MIKSLSYKDFVAFALFYEDHLWDFDLEDSEEELRSCLKRWREHYLSSLENMHSGDCTREPHMCMRCFVESCYERAKKIVDLMRENDKTTT